MRLAKVRYGSGEIGVVKVDGANAIPLELGLIEGVDTLADVLAAANPIELIEAVAIPYAARPLSSLKLLAPIDRQEVWAAGVTYKRSKVAREEESAGAAQFYDKVYSAPRPELFLKATAERVVHPNGPIRVRKDSKWNVPEPELTLMVSPDLRIVGYTIGNDVSSRDIEGENPLYLPQAKVYDGSCAIGPVVVLAASLPAVGQAEIRLVIRRNGVVAFDGATSVAQMARTPEDLVSWLGKENRFPSGVALLTGTGIVPPDAFSLAPGDLVEISIAGIGTLCNPVGW
jgi:2-dehydro-3-deoxy-D-arabinonate dehydratase